MKRKEMTDAERREHDNEIKRRYEKKNLQEVCLKLNKNKPLDKLLYKYMKEEGATKFVRMLFLAEFEHEVMEEIMKEAAENVSEKSSN